MITFSFKKITKDHLPLMHKWYNLRHVLRWYSKKPLDYSRLEKKYRGYISGEYKIYGFICYLNKNPIGYIQYYPASEYFTDRKILRSPIDRTAGIDLFIGEKSYIGKGFGKLMLLRFLRRHVFPYFEYCVVDPEKKNKKALKAYKSCGFLKVGSTHSEAGEPQDLLVKRKQSL